MKTKSEKPEPQTQAQAEGRESMTGVPGVAPTETAAVDDRSQAEKDAELGRNIRAGSAADPASQAAAARIAAGDSDARLPKALTLDKIGDQEAAIVVFDPHLKRFNCAVGDQVLSFTSQYAGIAQIRLDPKTGFTVAPVDKVREAVAADPLITK